MARGLIRTTRPITGRHRRISATASLQQGLPSAPAGRSAIGGQEVIGAATSTGAEVATTSTSPRPAIGPRIPSVVPAAETGGSRASIIGRLLPEIGVNAIFAAVAANRYSNPAPNLAPDLVPSLAPSPATSLAVGEPMSANAIGLPRAQKPRIAPVHPRLRQPDTPRES